MMMPIVFGSLERAAHMFSLFVLFFVLWRRHAGLCIVVATTIQGIVEDIKTKQISFGLKSFPVDYELKVRYTVCLDVFKGNDAKIVSRVIEVILQIVYDAKT